ncbi:hypothetical protein H9L13_09865 [Sphingomonas lutea]|uniref:Uncharacterized protein n=1 Tax=Sphingomonas lutea TaxID=1045317 RepID=A0A7G9SGH2_9SPHN|nr:DUF6481 family protein [Sphingomonas lutea]QNN66947.1 hypothetical protein H9L13_09865 [Sphingomonas lutea]
MKGFKEPDFHDRISRAAEAKAKALDQMRARPAMDEATLAARAEQARRRDAAAAANRDARKAATQAAKDEKAATAAAKKAAVKPILTDVERKAARDARYAARKKRK